MPFFLRRLPAKQIHDLTQTTLVSRVYSRPRWHCLAPGTLRFNLGLDMRRKLLTAPRDSEFGRKVRVARFLPGPMIYPKLLEKHDGILLYGPWNRILGTCFFEWHVFENGRLGANEHQLHSFAYNTAIRRKGLGTRLALDFLELARQRQVRVVRAYGGENPDRVESHNYDHRDVIAIYAKLTADPDIYGVRKIGDGYYEVLPQRQQA